MTASNAATAGGSALGSWFDDFLRMATGALLGFGISCDLEACSRSVVGTGTGCVGVLTGSDVVRDGEIGLGVDVTCCLSRPFHGNGFVFFLVPFSSQVSIGGAAEYLKDLGTIIFTPNLITAGEDRLV